MKIWSLILGVLAMLLSPILPVRAAQYPSLMETITSLGLTSNLKLALDAGNVESWPGNGNKWLDRSGGGYDFLLGADGVSTFTKPSFNGNVGNQAAEYFSTDGGDYFSYDAANETWMKTFPQAAISVFAVIYLPAGATEVPIAGTAKSGIPPISGNWEFRWDGVASRFQVYRVQAGEEAGGTYRAFGSAGPAVTAPGLYLVGMSSPADGTSYIVHVNGVTNTGGPFGAFTVSSSDATEGMKVLANGDLGVIAPNGTRLYALAMWQGVALTSANFTAIWTALRGRYGL